MINYFSAFTYFLHTYTKTQRLIQSICISKYNSYSTQTKSRHEELGCLILTRTTDQTMQSLDNTHERHQISTTGATSAVQPIGTNGLKKAENHNPQQNAPCPQSSTTQCSQTCSQYQNAPVTFQPNISNKATTFKCFCFIFKNTSLTQNQENFCTHVMLLK